MDLEYDEQGKFWAERYWSTDADLKTIIYYSAVIVGENRSFQKDASICRELEARVSLSQRSFSECISLLNQRSVINDATCQLRVENGVFGTIRELIEIEMGKFPPPLNGDKICQEDDDKKRYKIWVEEGSAWLKSQFNNKVSGLTIQEERLERHRGCFLTFETKINEPFLMIYFINTKRLTKGSEFAILTKRVQAMQNYRRKKLSAEIYSKQDLANGTIGIGLVAAPTYSMSVVAECIKLTIPLTGPINLASLCHYLDRHTKCRTEQYRQWLKFLYNFGGVYVVSDLIEQFKDIKCGEQDVE